MRSKVSKVGIITGSGVEFKKFQIKNKTIIVIQRHGRDYALPSNINYRENIATLRKAGVQVIIATAAVGAINPKMKPGDLLVLTDFIDFTKGNRETSTLNSFIDLSQPYDPELNKAIIETARQLKLKVHPQAVYACTEGPRFETKAEIKMFAKLGADVVGMTQVPEVVLAAEAGIPYAVIGVVTNFAAGVGKQRISAEEVVEVMKRKKKPLTNLLAAVVRPL
jgi:5'-methylthioadenosine phosphorylase